LTHRSAAMKGIPSLVTVWAVLLHASSTLAINVAPAKDMDNHRCKVMCQRFGMKALGAAFSKIHHPTECCHKCDEVYSKSFAQLRAKPEPVPEPAAPKTPKIGAPQVPAPVKR